MFRAAAAFLLVSSMAVAQTPASIANRTCRGTFQVPGSTSENGMGGFQFRFTGTDAALKGHGWRAFGAVARTRLDSELSARKLTNDMTGFEDTGDLVSLVMDRGHLTFNLGVGAKYDLMFDGTQLTGTVDPRGVPGRERWSVANVRLLCA